MKNFAFIKKFLILIFLDSVTHLIGNSMHSMNISSFENKFNDLKSLNGLYLSLFPSQDDFSIVNKVGNLITTLSENKAQSSLEKILKDVS